MAGDIQEFLSRLPPTRRVNEDTCAFLDKEIRTGADLNLLQRDIVFGIVQHCIEQNTLPPPPYESFLAWVYLDWSEEAKQSEQARPKLVDLVRRLKAQGPLASAVGQLAQQVGKERDARRKRELERLAAAVEAAATASSTRKSDGAAKDPPNVVVKKMQAARLGGGEN